MTNTWTAIVCGGTALFGLIGLILLGLRRRRGDEFALAGGAQDFDDEVTATPEYAKLRLAEIAELNAAELPGLIRLREELRQLPEFQPRHNRVLHYDVRDGATYQCTCGQSWPCARLVGRVWEGQP